MKLLEKQKEQKSRLKKQTTVIAANNGAKLLPVKPESNFPNLTVVIQNENRFIQTNKPSEVENEKKVTEVVKSPPVTKVPANKVLITTTNISLAKKVLVKNAMAQATDAVKAGVAASAAVAVAVSVKPLLAKPAQDSSTVPGEQSLNNATESNDTEEETKPASMTLAMFAKKTPKVKASLLANYIKRYKTHGFVIIL